MSDFKIIAIEDEPHMAEFLRMELTHEGYDVVVVNDGLEGYQLLEENRYDLILLDIMLPGMSGIEICRRVRKFCDTHIIMLTAKGDVSDVVNGLDTGADDYLAKPFMLEELLARIRAVFRKKRKDTKLAIYDLTLDTELHAVQRGLKDIELTKKEFDMLHILLVNKNKVMTREVLLDKVWGYDYANDYNAVDVFIRHLRAKIDEDYERKIITTVRGVGYVIKDET